MQSDFQAGNTLDQDGQEIDRPHREPASNSDMGFLVLLTLLNVLNMVDRQLLASFANYIVPDLQLSNTEFGLLTGVVFLFVYSVMGLFMGLLADTVNRTRLITIGLVLWSSVCALSGAARGFVSLAIPRMFIGVGESVLTPSTMSLLADRFPPAKLGFAAGFYYMGVPIGVGVSLLIAGYFGPLIGWRNCFYVLGFIGLALACFLWFVPETPRRDTAGLAPGLHRPTGPKLIQVARLALTTITSSQSLMLTIAGGVALHFILGALAFEQLWFVQERGFERSEIARLAGWLAIFGGVLGNLCGGIGSDLFVRWTGQGRPLFLFWLLLAMAPIAIIYRLVPGDSPWIWIGIFCSFFQIGACYGPSFATVQESVPASVRGTIVAFYLFSINLVGMGLGVTLAGISIDYMLARGVSDPYSTTLIVFTLISLLAIPCFLFAGLRQQADIKRMQAVRLDLSKEEPVA